MAQLGMRLSSRVFSTSVEVFLEIRGAVRPHRRFLHVRGGVSLSSLMSKMKIVSSPRPWRCFPLGRHARILARVFSTSVEVFSIEKLAGR